MCVCVCVCVCGAAFNVVFPLLFLLLLSLLRLVGWFHFPLVFPFLDYSLPHFHHFHHLFPPCNQSLVLSFCFDCWGPSHRAVVAFLPFQCPLSRPIFPLPIKCAAPTRHRQACWDTAECMHTKETKNKSETSPTFLSRGTAYGIETVRGPSLCPALLLSLLVLVLVEVVA